MGFAKPESFILAKSDSVLIRLDSVLAVLKWHQDDRNYLWAYTADGSCVRLFNFSQNQIVDTGLFSPWMFTNDFEQEYVDTDFFEDWEDNGDLFQIAFRCKAVQVIHCQHSKDEEGDYPFQFVLYNGEHNNCFSNAKPSDMVAAIMPNCEGPFPNMDKACKILDDNHPCWTSSFRAEDVECTTVHSESVIKADASAFVDVYMKCGEFLRVYVNGGDRGACAMHFFKNNPQIIKGTLPDWDDDDISDFDSDDSDFEESIHSSDTEVMNTESDREEYQSPAKRIKTAGAFDHIPTPSGTESMGNGKSKVCDLDDAWGNFCGPNDSLECECFKQFKFPRMSDASREVVRPFNCNDSLFTKDPWASK